MNTFKQCQDFDCGNQAVLFAGVLCGVIIEIKHVSWIEDCFVKFEAETGASHEAIIEGLHKLGLNAKEHIGEMHAPCIVNHLVADDGEIDGHYSVVIGIQQGGLFIYDPSDGQIKTCTVNEFDRIWRAYRHPPDRWSVSFSKP